MYRMSENFITKLMSQMMSYVKMMNVNVELIKGKIDLTQALAPKSVQKVEICVYETLCHQHNAFP